MNIIKLLQSLEKEIIEYGEVAGKDMEQVFKEMKDFLVGKKVEVQNAAAAKSNPTSSGPAAASAGSQAQSAATTAGANTNNPPPPKSAA